MQPYPWIIVTNMVLPIFERVAQQVRFGNFYIYAANIALPALNGDGLLIDVDDGFVTTITTSALAGRGAHNIADVTHICISTSQVSVHTSLLNATPVFLALDHQGAWFVLGTDLVITAVALQTLSGHPLPLLPGAGVVRGSASSVEGIQRFEHATSLSLYVEQERWRTSIIRHPDTLLVPKFHQEVLTDPTVAGEAQLNALTCAITESITGFSRSAVFVSGGVDSGLVAAIASNSSIPLTAYTIGTPWGNEFEHATELADALKVPLIKITLSEEELLAALPETIRALGHAEPEVVDIALTFTAFFRGRYAQESLILTGYGSDLINSGMSTGGKAPENIDKQVIDVIHQTRYSSEFSTVVARAYGYTLIHPFWDLRVMEVALRTSGKAKIAGGREKGHLRTIASTLLPQVVAWRSKTAIHHGNGLAIGLGNKIENSTGRKVNKASFYRSLLAELIDAACIDPFLSVVPLEMYERAVSTALRVDVSSSIK